jgi:DNA-binding MarR family transcriptional regulator
MRPEQLLSALRPTLHLGFVSSRSISVMLRLYIDGGSTDLGLIGMKLGISRPAMCRIADFLGIRGFTTRMPNEMDRRRRILTITEEGQAFVHKMLEAA